MRKPEEIIGCYVSGDKFTAILNKHTVNPETGVMVRRALVLTRNASTGTVDFMEQTIELSMMTISNLGDSIAWDDLPSSIRCRAWDWAQLASEMRNYQLNAPREIVSYDELRFNITRLLYEAPEVFSDMEIVGMYVSVHPVLATLYLGDVMEIALEPWYTNEFEGEPEEDRELMLRASPERDFARTFYDTSMGTLFITKPIGSIIRYNNCRDARKARICCLHDIEETMYDAACRDAIKHGLTEIGKLDELVAIRNAEEEAAASVHCDIPDEKRLQLAGRTVAKLREESGFKEHVAMAALFAFNRASKDMLQAAKDAWNSNFAEDRESLCIDKRFPNGGLELSGILPNGDRAKHVYYDYTIAEAIKMFLNEFPEVE